MKHLYLLAALALAGCDMVPDMTDTPSLSYHFDEPAQMWEETLPLGNGRLGMMPDGGVYKESITLNEITTWSGGPQDAINTEARKALPAIRELLFENRNNEAEELMYKTFVCKGEGSGQGRGANRPFGSYQLLGNLTIDYKYGDNTAPISDYRRELNLKEAIASTSFKKGKVGYKRDLFTSFSGDVGVIHMQADMEKVLNFTIGMNRPERYKLRTEGNDLVMEGQLNNGTDGNGLRYCARIRVVLPTGGSIKTDKSTVTVSRATEAILLVSMGTSYIDTHFEKKIATLLSQSEKKSYSILRKEHIASYGTLFNRVSLNLGRNERENLPINKRLEAFKTDKNDPSLASLYFQFGRYLLISSTRVGLLPPNLQGLWCNTINTPWNGDYHLNINLQMNLWPAEVTNLSELHRPMIEWIKKQVKSGTLTAKGFYNARGWVMHILGNVWEFTAPGEHPSWGATNTSAAWLCQHLYSHYLYSLDKDYLRQVYPVMKEASLFFVDMLVEDPRSKYLVTAPTTSPENRFKMENGSTASISAGSTMDNQLIRELFSNTIEAAGILKTDSSFIAELITKRARLMPTTIGKDGRIMEWLQPYEETEPTHRHVSHLYGLYPGNEISFTNTPELAQAAIKTLNARGDLSTGWSISWKINFWARLHDGNRAYKLLTDLLRPCVNKETGEVKGGGSYPNLFCAHPPLQIDGNFGGCAGIAEMLIQSQDGFINFLPALPNAWKNGSYSGLKVRGGGTTSAVWKDNRLKEAEIKAGTASTFRIKLPADTKNLSIRINNKPASLPIIDGMLTVDLKTSESLSLRF